MNFNATLLCLSLLNYQKAANDLEALVFQWCRQMLDEYSFTEVPKSWWENVRHSRKPEVFTNPVRWKRTNLTLKQYIKLQVVPIKRWQPSRTLILS